MPNDMLIVASNAPTKGGRVLSNFARTPFVLDGVRYESTEVFWQCLKIADVEARAMMAEVTDPLAAKRIGNQFLNGSQIFTYGGQLYRIGSREHHTLLERAIRAKVAQNDSVRRALLESGNATIRHLLMNKYGQFRVGNSPQLPAMVFEAMLTNIRTELQKGTFQETLPLPIGFNNS